MRRQAAGLQRHGNEGSSQLCCLCDFLHQALLQGQQPCRNGALQPGNGPQEPRWSPHASLVRTASTAQAEPTTARVASVATQASWDALLRASHKAEPAPHPSLEAGRPASLTWDGASQVTGVCPGWAPGPTAAPAPARLHQQKGADSSPCSRMDRGPRRRTTPQGKGPRDPFLGKPRGRTASLT